MPGKQNADADALSRAPVDHVTTSDELGEGLPSFPAKIAMMSLIGAELSTADPTLDPVLEKIKCAAAIDPIMLKLRTLLMMLGAWPWLGESETRHKTIRHLVFDISSSYFVDAAAR